MKKIPQYNKAIESLYDQTLFTDEVIKKMPIDQLKYFLEQDGLDIQKLTAKMEKQKAQWVGSKSYKEACAQGQSKTSEHSDVDLSSLSDDEIKAHLLDKYKRLEEMPLAARGFKGLGRIELESMYRDLILRGKKRA